MSGLFPSIPAASSIRVISFQPTKVSVTSSLKRQVRASGSQQFVIKLGFAPMTRDEFAPINAFIESQAGQFGTFKYIAPIESYTRGDTISLMEVKGEQKRGENIIEILPVNAPLLPGDYITFLNHSKVYMVANAGTKFIELTTHLLETLPNKTFVTYNAVPFTVARSKDLSEYSLNYNKHYSFNIDLVENL